MLRALMLVSKTRFFFLKVSCIRQQNPREIDSRGRRADWTFEALSHEARQVSSVIDMGVRQHDGVDGTRIDRWIRPIPEPQLLHALEKTAVDKNAVIPGVKEELGACYGLRRSKKSQL